MVHDNRMQLSPMTDDGGLLTHLQLVLSLVKYFILLYISGVCLLITNFLQDIGHLLGV
ncbi:hypothetical protein [Nostoc sp. 'Peltigera membranacea cyanobiont' 210A]|uniref:hypothetical protein n=1 Tax=Nostoc sp. 'Peltigera membranacea cyanobiont' 210A TaxID=2014529 RepID=UPI00167EC439|nr:hypothetical protein [Nostoc sp. 'Peltigera membranacea cyanobiont' 210A]